MKEVYCKEDKDFLLDLAREAINKELEQEELLIKPHNSQLDEKRGAFVTLHKGSQLRGCIGYPLPLTTVVKAVASNAVAAAFKDPRFPPLVCGEFNQVTIEISILTLPNRISSVEEIVIGRDGIIVSKDHHRGLLLPQVPIEQNWDLETYLKWGCMKAGLEPEEWKRGVDIQIFQAQVFGEEEKIYE